MQAWTVEGDFQMGRVRQHFAIEVVADDEAGAREACLTDLGSRHGAKRRTIAIEAVKPLKGDDASYITKHRLKD